MSQLEKIGVTRFNCFADLAVLSNPSSIFIGVSICPIDEVRVKLAWRFKRSIFILVTEPISSSKGEFVFRNLSSSVSHSRTSSISGFTEPLPFLPVLGRKVGQYYVNPNPFSTSNSFQDLPTRDNWYWTTILGRPWWIKILSKSAMVVCTACAIFFKTSNRLS